MGTPLKILRAGLALLVTFAAASAYARAPEESEFVAAGYLGHDIAKWVVDREIRPMSLGIYSVHSNYPLEQDFSTLVETEIIKGLAENDLQKVTSCAECRTAQVTVHDDRVVVSKGAPDIETIKRMGSRLPVEALLVVEIYRTKLNVIAHAVLYQNQTGVVLGAEKFRASAVNFSDSAVQILLSFGVGKVLAQTTAPGASSYSYAGNLLLLEEIGFGKGGLNVGAAFGNNSSLIYVNPTLSFRGRWGAGSITYNFNLGAGFGFTGGGKGISMRAAYEVFLGNITVVGLEGSYILPDRTTASTIKGFVGAHLGIALGK